MGGADGHNHRSLVGLDVHARATVAAVLEFETGELRFGRVNGPPRSVVGYLEELPGPVLGVYESGPVGYGLAREAAGRGLEVRVCAPGSIPREPGDRVKTDRRDAERLVRSLVAASCRSCGFGVWSRSSFGIWRGVGRRPGWI